jgi:predicted RNA-binding Zn-ribbon protein involved in translation (DUF1610 family)
VELQVKTEPKILLCPHCGTPHAKGVDSKNILSRVFLERLDGNTRRAEFRCGQCGGNVWAKEATWISLEAYQVWGCAVGRELYGIKGNGDEK